MVIDKKLKNSILDRTSRVLEDISLEDFLEKFDLSPEEAVFELYEAGLIDPEEFDNLTPLD